MARRRPDWSRPLPRPLLIPKVMTLRTLADMRKLIGHLPAEHRSRSTWQHVEAQLTAAVGGADFVDIVVALRMVLIMEWVECRPR